MLCEGLWSVLEGLREVVLSIRGAPPSRHLRELDSPGPTAVGGQARGSWHREEAAYAVAQRGGGEATECGGAIGGDMYKAAVNM